MVWCRRACFQLDVAPAAPYEILGVGILELPYACHGDCSSLVSVGFERALQLAMRRGAWRKADTFTPTALSCKLEPLESPRHNSFFRDPCPHRPCD